ncbi:MAG: hypothetical protein HDKAJFGB_01672 [Anaerolineae bacterium]|nr:hypothetical protein [Anaerolineae bacterium]
MDARDEFGAAFADEFVGALGFAAKDIARHGKHFAVLVQREFARNHRAALFVALDQQDAERQAANDAIARGKIRRVGFHADGIIANERAAFGNQAREFRVFGRINLVNAVAHDGDGAPGRVERGDMRGGIHAARETADNRHFIVREFGA